MSIRQDHPCTDEVTIDGLPFDSDPCEMRTASVFAVLAPSLLFVAASFVACDDSSGSGSSSGFESEAGSFEAGPQPDGASPDGFTPDGAKADGAMGTGVTVIVGDTASPQANVRVIFQDASGAILGEAKTDAAGMAVSTSIPSMVTVLYAPPAQPGTAVTFMSVTDGDTLHVTPSPHFVDTALGDIAVTFTPNAKTPFVYAFAGNTGCSNFNGTSPILIHMRPECAHTQNTIFVEADDATTTQGYALAKMVASPAGGNTVNVLLGPITPAGQRTLVATNLPSAESPSGSAAAISGTDMHFLPSTSASSITDATGLVLYVPRDSVEAFETGASTSHALAGGFSITEILQRELATPAATGAFTPINFSTALPYVTGVDATATARPDVTISTSAVPAAAAAYTKISWGASNAQTWTFVMPGNTKTFKVPAIPTDATTFTPTGPITVEAVGYADGPLLASYAALKALPIPTETLPSLMNDQLALPANGLLEVSTYQRSNGD